MPVLAVTIDLVPWQPSFVATANRTNAVTHSYQAVSGSCSGSRFCSVLDWANIERRLHPSWFVQLWSRNTDVVVNI